MSRPTQQALAPPDALTRFDHQERRIKQLEADLAQTDSIQRLRASKLPFVPNPAINTSEHVGAIVNDRMVMLRGKSFKTQFDGMTRPAALITHLPDFHLFTKETFEQFPALAKIRHDMHTLEDRASYAGATPRLTTGNDLKALLPAKDEADQLVQLYMNNYGCIYHVLHSPSFRKEYEEMWTAMAQARPHFIAIVLLMMASAQCLTSAQPLLYSASSSTTREKAITYIQACDDWLKVQSQKHVTAADFQIRFLLLVARVASDRKHKRIWTEAGTLLRFCMTAGLHRNPDLLQKKTSPLDKELRRRMWAAVVELELQMSFDRGMVPDQWPMQADSSAPGNIRDEDLNQDLEQLPNAARTSELTGSSYLAVASESILLRHRVCSALNNIRQTLLFDDVKRLTEEIEAEIQNIPDWAGDSAALPRALLSLNLRNYLLVLHDRQLRQAETTTERSFSRMIVIDTATRIIDTHRSLINKGCYALELMCNDPLRAALSICHVATTVNVRADSAIGQIIEHHADRVMDEAIQMLTDKLDRFGREQRQLWIALAAHGCWKAKKDPSQRLMFMQEAVDKITTPYYKIMACQVNTPAASAASPAPALEGTNYHTNTLSNGKLEDQPTLFGAIPDLGEAPMFDFDGMGAWTFDDWAFDGINPQTFIDPYQPFAP
ncbi:hypothetical protein LTR08_006015 [Meristemomyces frigidus]|nr:hypothetical protein LTR08_006015 [Meristemomyces frigidus]